MTTSTGGNAAPQDLTDTGDPRRSAVPPLPPWAARTAYASAAVATVLLIPLHLVWALGIPRWAGVQRLHAWHQGGGGTYLFMLILLALFPGALALALAHPWESVFPRWLPVVAGRAVPRLLLIVPAVALAVFLLAYAVFATIVLPQQWNDPGVFFSSWIVAFGLAQFPIWAIGLLVATRAYARRTAPRRSARLAPSGGREALPQLARVRAH